MNLIRKQFRIGGMTCVNCQNRIEQKLCSMAGIKVVSVSYSTSIARITFDSDLIRFEDIAAVIEELDYEVLPDKETESADISRSICLLVIIIALYILLQRFGILNLLAPSQLADSRMGYGMLFVVGLITSVHCIAMCGGINLSQCIPRTGEISYAPAFLYNIGRVISYTIIGLILGSIGWVVGGGSGGGVSIFIQGLIKLIAGIFMVIMGINLLGIFPWMRRLSLRMPKFFAIKIGKQKMTSSRPLVVGLLNGLMPCGPLQAMWLVALASGNPVTGALSMFFFSLGTVPLMLGFGSLVSALGKRFTKAVMNVGAVLVVVLGLAMFSQGGSLSGLFHTNRQNVSANSGTEVQIIDGVQIVNSTLAPGTYPDITVQAGIPVKWIIDAPEGSINGCNYKMIIQEYGIEHAFEEGENIIEFTPAESGTVEYSCWMGMIYGNIYVVDNIGETASEEVTTQEEITGGSACCDTGTVTEIAGQSSCCSSDTESSCCD